jgi:very-short-patch-repair endonuclease
MGINRHAVASEIRAGRWRAWGDHTIAVHTGLLSTEADRWRAVWEVGAHAALDGVTALHAAGLDGFDSPVLHVSVPHANSHHPRMVEGVRIHRVRRRPNTELTLAGVPRARPGPAALRAAHWAVTNRQAALLLCLVVQQRLVRPGELIELCPPARGRTRRAFVGQVVADVADGAHSLGELDFAALCRARDLPEPGRQVVRTGPRGRIYLDVRWERIGLVAEIDGAQHRQGLAVSSDNLRRNSLALGGDTVLTIDLVGLRVMEDEFMTQVEHAIRALSLRAAG